MEATQKRYYSPEEYLELETKAEYRSEYIDGEIIPMAGGTSNHNEIAGNFFVGLKTAFRRQNYRVFMTDMRLWIPEKRLYTYPDVLLVAKPLEYALNRKDTITNAMLVAEVLSDSTENYDRLDKFKMYRTLPTFKEYVLIAQSEMQIQQFYKNENNQWVLAEYEGENSVLSLKCVDFQIPLSELYENVEFETPNPQT